MSGQNTCCKNKCAQLKQKNSSVRRMITNKHRSEFPGGTVDKNLPVNAGDMGSIPGPGRFHMPGSNWARVSQLLSPSSRAGELQVLKLVHPKAIAPQWETPPQWEACMLQWRAAPACRN